MLLPAIVNVPVPRETLPPKVPPPESEPRAVLKLLRSKAAPALFPIITIEFDGNAFATAACNVPLFIVVVPP